MFSTKEKIVRIIEKNGQASVVSLDKVLTIGRVMIHRHLKALLSEGRIGKVGTPPKVTYVSVAKKAARMATPKKTHKRRPISLKSVAEFVSLPVVASAGCDSGNVFAEERIEEYMTIDKRFLPKKKKASDVVFVRAVGESMNDAGIENGDLVLVEKLRAGEARENDRVVALVNNTLVIKSIHFTPNAVVLRPQSKDPRYQPIIAREDIAIPGRVIDVVRMSLEERYEKMGEAV